MPGDPFYQSAEWKACRSATLRAAPGCAVAGCDRRPSHVDHIVSRRRGGAPFDPANLQTLCHSHHTEKTNRVDGGGGRNLGGNSAGGALVMRARGCDADGNPLDPRHTWRRRSGAPTALPDAAGTATQGRQNPPVASPDGRFSRGR